MTRVQLAPGHIVVFLEKTLHYDKSQLSGFQQAANITEDKSKITPYTGTGSDAT